MAQLLAAVLHNLATKTDINHWITWDYSTGKAQNAVIQGEQITLKLTYVRTCSYTVICYHNFYNGQIQILSYLRIFTYVRNYTF